VLPPVELFRLCANAAHDASTAPKAAYVAYHDITRTRVTRHSQSFGVKVTIDNATGNVTVRSDEGQRSFVARVAQPVAADFDALSDFLFKFNVDDDAKLHFAYAYAVRPLVYTRPPESERKTDAVAYSLKGYQIEYADETRDESLPQYHLKLRPVDDEHRRVIHFTDLYVDAATKLPVKVVFEGDDATQMVFDYANAAGHLVVQRFFYTRRIYGPAHVIRSTVEIESTFDNVVFTDRDPYATPAEQAPAASSRPQLR
jgi:hypothetical protein